MSFSLFLFCFVCLTDKKFWFSGETTKPEKYGYRKGSKEEARSGKLKQTMNRVVSNVAEGSLTGTVSKGWKKQVTQATQAAKGNAEKAEFLEKQLHLEKAAREKQQQDMEEMKRVVEELKKGNAAAPFTFSESSQSLFRFAFLHLFHSFHTPTSFSFSFSCLDCRVLQNGVLLKLSRGLSVRDWVSCLQLSGNRALTDQSCWPSTRCEWNPLLSSLTAVILESQLVQFSLNSRASWWLSLDNNNHSLFSIFHFFISSFFKLIDRHVVW